MTEFTNEQKIKLFEWFEANGEGAAIISDDRGNWACSETGFQNIASGDEPIDIQTTFLIESSEWVSTIWEAIYNYMEDDIDLKEYEEGADDESVPFVRRTPRVDN